MILTGDKIKEEVFSGNIIISPFNENNINPNSYNYLLGDTYIEVVYKKYLDSKKSYEYTQKLIPKNGLILKPNKLYLCNTFETIGSSKYVTSLIGKSSLGRLGLFLQISSNLGHQDEIHKWTLELRCCKPLKIYPNMIIGQVTFWRSSGPLYNSKGYYKYFDAPKSSKGI